jgi:hypothetical protein
MINRTWFASLKDAIMNGDHDDDLEQLSTIDSVAESEVLSIADAAKTRRAILALSKTSNEER